MAAEQATVCLRKLFNRFDARIYLEIGALELKLVTQDYFAKASQSRGFFTTRVFAFSTFGCTAVSWQQHQPASRPLWTTAGAA